MLQNPLGRMQANFHKRAGLQGGCAGFRLEEGPVAMNQGSFLHPPFCDEVPR